MAEDAETVQPSLPYHEPSIATILVQSSFLLLLNLINALFDRLLYCGLLGQVLVGIAWGTPGAKFLSIQVEQVVVQLGYIGLIMLVYEGGLSTSFPSLKANLLLSSAVAFTGIALPIALSYTLQGLLHATPLQAFAAGAALCSTSLGTTFTVLASSGLSQTRLGVVLSSAAMMDDVVGLIMVQVISNLGGDNGDITAVTILRPVLVSLAFAIMIPLSCRYIVQPLTVGLNSYRKASPDIMVSRLLTLHRTALTIHTLLLAGLVAASSYAGTSNLFAAYIAGAVVSWWDSEVPHPPEHMAAVRQDREGTSTNDEPRPQKQEPKESPPIAPQTTASIHSASATTGPAVYQRYYHEAVSKILQPLFFASIGFSIPITRMFQGAIVWRGILYTVLMMLAKMACGLWLVRWSFPFEKLQHLLSRSKPRMRLPSIYHFWQKHNPTARHETSRATTPVPHDNGAELTLDNAAAQPEAVPSQHGQEQTPHTCLAPKPVSLQPALILGCAMVARGEIGFLISAIAESNGVFSGPRGTPSSSESEMFLVVTWAIVLCTIVGPLGVGLVVRRVKKLQETRDGDGRNVLGVWGVG
ncbi:Sodium/hydrogen exchanger [Periconia macrospinosa]|uniref:Sodium/hydrogen exchanger n=1 Tax=Periconia macrospinosa TaxID=97972 RepID=A0A2V1DZJ4_9PLEO|nr:Sodium/hydrogen exchanger [Periconia macrospinosa]